MEVTGRHHVWDAVQGGADRVLLLAMAYDNFRDPAGADVLADWQHNPPIGATSS